MLGARRKMVDQVYGTTEDGSASFALHTKPPKNSDLLGDDSVGYALEEAMDNISTSGADANFIPLDDDELLGVVTYPLGNSAARRHEVMHAYNEAARRGYTGMPLASRAVALLGAPGPGIRGGAATVADEFAAQLAGGTRFSRMPWDFYANRYADSGLGEAALMADVLNATQKYGPAAGIVGAGAAISALKPREERMRVQVRRP